jgi:hypothetical protein
MPAGGTGALPGAASASGAPGGGNGGAALAGIGFALQKAQQAGAAASARMEQTAAHAGMQGAYPYSTVSGGQRQQLTGPRQQQGGSAAPAPEAEQAPPQGTQSPAPGQGDALAGGFPPWPQDSSAGPQASDPPTQPLPPAEGAQ